jgi:hypothetical protein
MVWPSASDHSEAATKEHSVPIANPREARVSAASDAWCWFAHDPAAVAFGSGLPQEFRDESRPTCCLVAPSYPGDHSSPVVVGVDLRAGIRLEHRSRSVAAYHFIEHAGQLSAPAGKVFLARSGRLARWVGEHFPG